MNLDLGYTRLLLGTCFDNGLNELQTSYVLGTVYWETGKTMDPVEEAYYLGGEADSYRRKLRYFPWYGRGFVQLTWKRNYIKAAKFLGIPVGDGSFALDPKNSAVITVIGMRDGWFTGKKLSNYIVKDTEDFIPARKIVNGLDHAEEIADLALAYIPFVRAEFVRLRESDEEVVPSLEEHWLLRLLKFLVKVFVK